MGYRILHHHVAFWLYSLVGGEKLVTRLRLWTFRRFLTMEMGYFDNPKNSTGALSTRLYTDAALVATFVGTPIGIVVKNASTLIIG
jgi:ATP-binding cassette subfamily B (MDR/TAP) protein 1